ncbi:hypothetical protein GCM10010289_81040 [Streptomyces violascens]|uniref:Pyridoxamine 5'-phosphate oxidase putative domain-containing protein n=1 Tax=Streptomyces violascens TaxID=67381 RepID=A0ABQ3QRM6_9ACTN|nr:hypothetical protein GCM10010289_81040 [Streptomyces violascens]GHI39920.1 hypothetical protein Sviol_43280 [Streptomyces violascens]
MTTRTPAACGRRGRFHPTPSTTTTSPSCTPRASPNTPAPGPAREQLTSPANAPYTYAEVRGTATMTTEGGQELIDELSRKYTGKDYADFNPASADDAERVVVRITPRKIVGSL